jgi:leucine dehydrogenase
MIREQAAFDEHEKVLFCSDGRSGLRAIISIHSTRLGPAAGGCRMFPYASEREALEDVLRLSRAMTYKNALAGLNLGGGKAVIIGDPADPATADRLSVFGQCVENLGGIYWTAEDVGVDLVAVEHIARTTRFVFGTASRSGSTGDPSAFTARGVLAGLRAAVQHRLRRDSIRGLRVAVQGVGAVGWELSCLLHQNGAQLIVADRSPDRAARAERELGARVVPSAQIHRVEADVFAPCALGAALTQRTIAELTAQVVAGAANNQLQDADCGAALHDRRILYAPDFVVNAGGMQHASGEIFGTYDEAAVIRSIDGIYDTVLQICARAQLENGRPEAIAMRLAAERLSSGPRQRDS